MKILKPGKLPDHKKVKGTCDACGCVFVCERCETKYSSDQRDGDFYSIRCPQAGCNNLVYFAASLFVS